VESTMEGRDLLIRLGDDEVLVLDCRPEDDWCHRDVQVPGALRMNVAEIAASAHILPDDELIVLYDCGRGATSTDVRRAYRILRMRGLDPIILDGGLHSWIAHGFPTERRADAARGPAAVHVRFDRHQAHSQSSRP
jgi:rhodanese-related sulfurtransferase